MSYESEIKKMSRTKIDYVELDLDFCDNAFGTSPCTATDSVKCFNTFHTCLDQVHYSKTVNTISFINADLPLSVINQYYPARPYIVDGISDLPTEIKEDDTVTRRLKIKFADEHDNDVGIDPYRDSRTSIKGNFWKKLIARNPNYKGRKVRLYQGLAGLPTVEFQQKFTGRIEKITINKNYVIIEIVDLMKKLSQINYPFDNSVTLAENLPAVFAVDNEAAMLELKAQLNDYAEKATFNSLEVVGFTSSIAASDIPFAGYNFTVIAYDSNDNAFAKGTEYVELREEDGDNEITLDITGLTNATYYRIYSEMDSGYEQVTALTWSYRSATFTSGTAPEVPTAAVIFQLTGSDPAQLSNWTEVHDPYDVALSDASELNSDGYVKVEDEIIYYDSKSGNTIQNLQRGMFDTEKVKHGQYDVVYSIIFEAPNNPFTLLKNLLTKAGIEASEISSKFTTYETEWSGIDLSLPVAVKETKLNKLFFQLVNSVDCICWQNEEGKIDIVMHDETPNEFKKLTDGSNFAEGSLSVDLNDESRKTRFIFYRNRIDLEKGVEEKDAYNRIAIVVDATAESSYDANEVLDETLYSTWINDDCGTESVLAAYVSDLLNKRRLRKRLAQNIISGTLEMKDSDITTGMLVRISTAQIQDVYGNDISDAVYRVISKKIDQNKISIKLKRVFSKEFYRITEADDYRITELLDNRIVLTN